MTEADALAIEPKARRLPSQSMGTPCFLQRQAAMQRLPTSVAGGRTHADWHQAAVEPCGRRRLEWPLFKVQRT
jgi:hypothetical protein